MLRDMHHHLQAVREVHAATTLTQQDQVIKSNGVRYSELLRLPYFNIITQHIIDPMYNLYLGTAKNMAVVWNEAGILVNKDFELIQSKIDSIRVPFGMGKIPYKINSRFSELTADQWRNRTNILHRMEYCHHGIINVGQSLFNHLKFYLSIH